MGDGEIFAGLLPEVVATGAGICDKALMRGQNRVARHIFRHGFIKMKPNSQMTLGDFFRQCVGIDISKKKFTACLYMYDKGNATWAVTLKVSICQHKVRF